MANSNVLSQKSGKSDCQTRVRQTIVTYSEYLDVRGKVCNPKGPVSKGSDYLKKPSFFHKLYSFPSSDYTVS